MGLACGVMSERVLKSLSMESLRDTNMKALSISGVISMLCLIEFRSWRMLMETSFIIGL